MAGEVDENLITALIEPIHVLLALEDFAVVDTDTLEDSVAIKEPVVKD
jgi:hypothetical protein